MPRQSLPGYARILTGVQPAEKLKVKKIICGSASRERAANTEDRGEPRHRAPIVTPPPKFRVLGAYRQRIWKFYRIKRLSAMR